MSFRNSLLVLLLSVAGALSAQSAVVGRLTDAATGDPVDFATVYLDGTSIGDISGADGSFKLRIPAGKASAVLVVSHLNYVTQYTNLERAKTDLRIRLVAKAAELTRIEVEDADLRADNLKEFRNNLIGRDEWGRNVVILNDEVIRFDRNYRTRTRRNVNKGLAGALRSRNLRDAVWSDDGKTLNYSVPLNLRATSKGALRVQLTDLGYELHLDLNSYRLDYKTRQMAYLGTNFFHPVEGASEKKQRRYERNREKAYYGSSMHFIRSLLADSLVENGFQVYEVFREPSHKKGQDIRPVNLQNYLQQDTTGNYVLTGLSQNNYAILYSRKRRKLAAEPQLDKTPNTLNSRMFLSGLSAIIYPDGTLGDTNLIFSGDIGDRKMAWLLPSDYYPPE